MASGLKAHIRFNENTSASVSGHRLGRCTKLMRFVRRPECERSLSTSNLEV
mgnify:CR=1 FL=1